MTPQQAASYPKLMEHRTLGRRRVGSPQEEAALGKDWKLVYSHRNTLVFDGPDPDYDPAMNKFPSCRYHAEHGSRIVQNPDEVEALGEGWVDTPLPEPSAAKPGQPDISAAGNVALLEQIEDLKAGHANQIEEVRATFDRSWNDLSASHAELASKHGELLAKHEGLKAAYAELETENAALKASAMQATEAPSTTAQPLATPKTPKAPK